MKMTKRVKCEAKQLFRLCLVNGVLDKSRALEVVRRVIERKRRDYLAQLSEFQRLVRRDREEHTAEVETAVPLAADLQATIQGRLEEVYGAGINTQFVERPLLIGGMRIKVGSDVYDDSLRSRLSALGQRFDTAQSDERS